MLSRTKESLGGNGGGNIERLGGEGGVLRRGEKGSWGIENHCADT